MTSRNRGPSDALHTGQAMHAPLGVEGAACME